MADDLEAAIIAEILSRVDAKSLIRCRCVSKPWQALLSESYFIKKHLSNINTKSISNCKLILSTSPSQVIEYQALSNIACSPSQQHDDDNNDDSRVAASVDYPAMVDLILIDYVGSCNGLVCTLHHNGNMVFVSNPCTRVIQPLPYRTRFSVIDAVFYGFSYDSVADDYKVVVESYRPLAWKEYRNWGSGKGFEETMIQIFAMKGGYWRTLESLEYMKLNGMGCVVNGALHWLESQSWDNGFVFFSRIMCFGLAEENFTEIALPFGLHYAEREYDFVGIGPVSGCLIMYYKPKGSDYSVWMMKEYGVEESWGEMLRIPVEVLGVPQEFGYCLQPLLFFDNGEVLMNLNGEMLALYNQKDKKFRNVFKAAEMYPFGFRGTLSYVETLVSPLIGDQPH